MKRLAAAALAGGLLALGCGGDSSERPDCGERFDSAGWKASGRGDDRRIALARQLAECEALNGLRRRDVERLLGPPTRRPYEVTSARWPVDDDAFGRGENQDLVVLYDPDGRVKATRLDPVD
jgi:hypothetical protein